ncbi:MAG: folylpolyglutamate synthase/dihydrofolate synthase family protein [Termitinemataceae bacterium]|nr:MAG: folylpolyglutamate synthase/dihydrofolate synthase family protein [Termitinemataceae bacterium]
MKKSDGFKTSDDIFDWLSQFINLEAGYAPPSMRPERMQIIAKLADNPQNCAPAIHIAGSKGKGSITAMVTCILEAAGLRVARYMSPHITEYRERITLGDAFFDESIYLSAGKVLHDIAEILCDRSSPEYKALCEVSDGAPEPTFFELLTLFYFLCAKEAKVDAMAVETGMGGRLDPTNIVPSAVSVITVIELEHTEFLGKTIQSVAGEKAGIIKKGKPVIVGEQNFDEALLVFKNKAIEQQSEFFYLPQVVDVKNITLNKHGTDFTLDVHSPLSGDHLLAAPQSKQKAFFEAPLKLSLGIPGIVQAKNAALSVIAVKKAFPNIDAPTIQKALKGFNLPGRFEKVLDNPTVVVDGAHTEFSVQLCVDTWKELYGDGGIVIFGCALGKNTAAMAASILSCFDTIIITTPGTFKMSNTQEIYDTFETLARCGQTSIEKNTKRNIEILHIKNTNEAIRTTIEKASKHKKNILGVGSFYLTQEIRDYIRAYN